VLASGRNGARGLEHGDLSARHGARAQPSQRRLRDSESPSDAVNSTELARNVRVPAKPEPRAGRESHSSRPIHTTSPAVKP
jgi:hypothetical protein